MSSGPPRISSLLAVPGIDEAAPPRLASGVHARVRTAELASSWRSEQQDVLTALRWNLDAAQRFLSEKDTPFSRKLAEDALQRAQDCGGLSARLLQRGEAGLAPVPIVGLVKATLALVRWGLEERLLVHEALPEGELEVSGDEARLRGMLLGLLLAVYEETPGDEPWRHDLVLRGREEGPMFVLEIQEFHGAEGPLEAPPREAREAREEERLLRCARALQEHGGFLDTDATTGGKTVRISLPRVCEAHEVPASQRPTARLPSAPSPRRDPDA